MADPREWTAVDAAAHLKVPTPDSDKYSRGVVGVRTGSAAYPGAAVLGVEAAWRAGAGMVRYSGPACAAVLARRPETVCGIGRVQAWVIGSGTDAASRDDAERAALQALLDADAPVVVDAGAIDLAPGARAPLVVTPHAREFARLRELIGLAPVDVDAADAAERADAVALTAGALGRTVLLRVRAPDRDPGGTVLSVRSGTPWLAVAGTGDVLAGIIGAVVASRADDVVADPDALAGLVATGAWIHGSAGRVAAGEADPADLAAPPDSGAQTVPGAQGSDDPRRAEPGHPITALDVAEAVPRVIGALLRLARDGAGTSRP